MLKQLMLTKKLEQARAALAELLNADEDIKKRSEDLIAAIDEAETDEEIAVVEENVDTLNKEKEELEEKKSKLESEISNLEKQIEELNSKEPDFEKKERQIKKEEVENTAMERKMKFYGGLTRSDAESFVKRADVVEFLGKVRGLKGESRGVTGGELGIPDVILGLIKDNLDKYSKLITKVNLRPVGGKARTNIAGTIPEAVWTEACAKLNELNLVYNQIEMDGYKVGGYIPICNAILEDSDFNLANEILESLSQAIGIAIDKAILYGTGTKMPVGIATRLAQIEQPTTWGVNAPEWTNLSSTNLLKFDGSTATPEAFFAALVKNLGVASPKYATGNTFWAMNRKTKTELLAKGITFNAAGAVVSGQLGTVPVEGGDIVELEFVPDNDIIGGYGSLYLLAERAGGQFAVSEHVKFIEDNTVFKGTARYDGAPVRGEAFVIVNIANAAPTTTIEFAEATPGI